MKLAPAGIHCLHKQTLLWHCALSCGHQIRASQSACSAAPTQPSIVHLLRKGGGARQQ